MIGLDTFATHFKDYNDLASFIEQMEENPPDTQNMFKAMGIGAIDAGDLIEQLKQTFKLERDNP